MPGPLAGAAIGGAMDIAGNIINNQANKNLAEQQQNWAQAQWEQQNNRDDELWNRQNEYNLELWNMQNEYNSPQAQMARFAEAGLNPHLIYGKGTAGTAGSVATQGIKSSDIKPYTRAQSQSVTRGLDVFGQYNQFKQLQAQTDNIKAQTAVAKQEALYKAQQTFLTAAQTDSTGQDLKLKKATYENQVDAAAANLELVGAKINKETEALETQKQSTESIRLQNNLKRYGVQPSDPLWLRAMSMGGEYFKTGKDLYNWLTEKGFPAAIENAKIKLKSNIKY